MVGLKMKGGIFDGDDEMRMSKRWREQICAKLTIWDMESLRNGDESGVRGDEHGMRGDEGSVHVTQEGFASQTGEVYSR